MNCTGRWRAGTLPTAVTLRPSVTWKSKASWMTEAFRLGILREASQEQTPTNTETEEQTSSVNTR